MSGTLSWHRKSTRFPGFDYSTAGWYFVTLAAWNHQLLFGKIEEDKVVLNGWGAVVSEEWERSAEIRKEMDLDAFVVMPNHVHGIVVIGGGSIIGTGDLEGRPQVAPTKMGTALPVGPNPRSLGSFIAGFKGSVTRRLKEIGGGSFQTVWQRNFHDRIIRNQQELDAVRQYIADNPKNWGKDKEPDTQIS